MPDGDGYRVTVAGQEYGLKLKKGAAPDSYIAEFSDKPVGVTVLDASLHGIELRIGGERLTYQKPPEAMPQAAAAVPQVGAIHKEIITSPMPGKVIGALVKPGEAVKAGDPLIMLESMKMEVAVRADRDGEVKEIMTPEGSVVKRGQGLVRLG